MQIFDESASVSDFLDAAGARQPTPGGGAVAALAGALAASMGEMAVRYSTGKRFAEHEALHREIVDTFERGRALLTKFVAEDQSAYLALVATKDASEEDKVKALSLALATPRAVAAAAVEMLALAEKAVPTCNKYLLSDLAVCCELSMAAVRCGLHNVRVNLVQADEETIGRVAAESAALLERAAAIVARSIKAIHDRQREG